MATKWAVLCEFLPETDGTRKVRLGAVVYDTEQEALDYKRQVLRENLPYKVLPFSFEDPRDALRT
jgi:hypothetical protein